MLDITNFSCNPALPVELRSCGAAELWSCGFAELRGHRACFTSPLSNIITIAEARDGNAIKLTSGKIGHCSPLDIRVSGASYKDPVLIYLYNKNKREPKQLHAKG